MRQQTFFWHDYETWGADPKRDRAVQFAGVRTDAELNIVGEPVSIFCRPADDMLPQPEACLITGITPQQALREGLAEAEFFARIQFELGQPGTCGVGYNSLRFDDEFTRYGLYRNFFDPYAREWKGGNGRWDIIDMVRLTRALRPEGIEWPTREDGSTSFRLEELTAANGIGHTSAHEALSDVHATIALARLIRERQPRLYHFVLENKEKDRAGALLDLRDKAAVLHVSRMFPAALGCMAVVMPLIAHPTNRNGVIVCDLRHDPREWLSLDAGQIGDRLYTATTDRPEGQARIPLKTVHLNRCPVLAPLNTLTEGARAEWGIDLDRCEEHRRHLLSTPGLMEKLVEVFSQSPFPPSGDPDQGLYEGFLGDADRRLCDRVRSLSPSQLADGHFAFEDKRLKELLFRYRARNWPESLDEPERARWDAFRRARLTDPNGGGSISLQAYRETLAELRVTRPDRLEIIDALEQWPDTIGLTS
ncbi:MAG: exodeoxyribonuclease I [Gammaproteobacteria bacterium RIFOXYA12_FULL_61_12]|nr:MAG: exodeoxyribonuclease I [Gammaproteobacteria bacterium RIFOXYD12_FULL_61_37]OGT93907.1 MAG: exodeoxyribonuclease I [Gammaproteobacteria bacterium RIFOXYA12_FULL_61_12]